MKKTIYALLLLVFTCAADFAHAQYNANMRGELLNVMVYTDGDYIYFQLKNQPTAHPVCKPHYFVISETLPENRRNQLYSRLLAAYAAHEPINIGYDATTECAHGYIMVHRVG